MSAKIFSGSMLTGLACLTAGIAWRFGPPVGLIAFGTGVIVLTLVTVRVAGRRNAAE